MSDLYVGLMSGTSLDGISSAVVRFSDDGARVAHELIGFAIREYTPKQRAKLHAAMREGTAESYCRINVELGVWLADAAIAVIAESGVAKSAIRAIGSHGHTLWHVPATATWQTGDAATLAERTSIDVVNDFRARDVAAGGHGAPLVPIADALLYSHPSEWRLMQNIGGMANVTVVPPGGAVHGVRAFDTGPGVAIIDAVTRAIYPDLRYDVDGVIAASGVVRTSVVDTFLADPYFVVEPPKSTGRELFNADYINRFIEACRNDGAGDADIVASAVSFTARSIAFAYDQFIAEPASEVVVSGGGAKNKALLRMLERELAMAKVPRRLVPFSELFYDGEAKEAVAFALLAHLHVTHRPGNVIGATGARGPRVLGALTPA